MPANFADLEKKLGARQRTGSRGGGPARAVWRESQPGFDPQRLVFIDESWASTNMARLYGRGLRGARVVTRCLPGTGR